MIRHDESGYSIVEVMVAILILMAAIIPMFKMFDVSLQTAMRSSDYDRARALAEKQTEIAQSISFASLKDNFPFGCTDTTACVDDSYLDLRFSVEKSYVAPDNLNSTTIELTNAPDDTKLIKLVITVYEEGNSSNEIFRTVGVIADKGSDD